MRIAPAVHLSPDQREALEQRARSRSLPARVVERARIVLLAAHGQQDKEIAATMKITPKKVSRWRSRFRTLRMAGLERDASRTHPGDRKLHRSSQRKSQTLYLDGSRVRHFGKGQACSPWINVNLHDA